MTYWYPAVEYYADDDDVSLDDYKGTVFEHASTWYIITAVIVVGCLCCICCSCAVKARDNEDSNDNRSSSTSNPSSSNNNGNSTFSNPSISTDEIWHTWRAPLTENGMNNTGNDVSRLHQTITPSAPPDYSAGLFRSPVRHKRIQLQINLDTSSDFTENTFGMEERSSQEIEYSGSPPSYEDVIRNRDVLLYKF